MPLSSVAERAILGKGDTSAPADRLSAILSLLLSCSDRSRLRGGIVLTNDWAHPKGVCCADCSVLQSVRDSFESRPETRMECQRGAGHHDSRWLLDMDDVECT